MAFETYETSRDGGDPVELYLFRYGSESTAVFGYTNHDAEIVYAGITYAPIPIERQNVVASGGIDRADVKITLPASSGLAQLFVGYPPSQVVTLTIRQGHLTDPDAEFPALWLGRVVGPVRNGRAVELVCQSAGTSLARAGLRRHYQIGCTHAVYSDACGASRAARQVDTTAASVSATGIVLPGGWNGSVGVSKFVNGIVEWDHAGVGVEVRTILAVAGNSLTLAGNTRGLIGGQAVRVLPGCNHTTGDCRTLHENIQNYGGQPYMPTNTPLNKNVFN